MAYDDSDYKNYGGYVPKEYLAIHGGSSPRALFNAVLQQSTQPKSANPYENFLQHALNVSGQKTAQSMGPVQGVRGPVGPAPTPQPWVPTGAIPRPMPSLTYSDAPDPVQILQAIGQLPSMPARASTQSSLDAMLSFANQSGAEGLLRSIFPSGAPQLPVGGGKTGQSISRAPDEGGGGGGGGGGAAGGTQTQYGPGDRVAPTPAAPSITGNSAAFIQSLGPEFNWVQGRPELLTEFQKWATAANFAQNPDDFKTWAWAMDVGPQKDDNRRQLALAEIYRRYHGDWLQGRGDVIWAWENDPSGKKAGKEFGAWLQVKGWNQQNPAPNWGGALDPQTGTPPPATHTTPTSPTNTTPTGTPTHAAPPAPVAPAPTTPGGLLGNSDALVNLQRALQAHYNNQANQAARQFRSQGSMYGLENTGAYGQGMQELMGNLAVQFGTQGAEALHQSYENELDRLLQKYGIDTGASTQRYGVDVGAATAGRGQSLDYQLGLGRLAGDEQGRFMDYDLGQRQIGAGVYGDQMDTFVSLINAIIQAGPENTSPAMLNALAGFMPGSYSYVEE